MLTRRTRCLPGEQDACQEDEMLARRTRCLAGGRDAFQEDKMLAKEDEMLARRMRCLEGGRYALQEDEMLGRRTRCLTGGQDASPRKTAKGRSPAMGDAARAKQTPSARDDSESQEQREGRGDGGKCLCA